MRTYFNNALDKVMVGDRVTVVNRFGQTSTGKVALIGTHGPVLNMGGRYGTPQVATLENIVSVKRGGQTVLVSHQTVKENLLGKSRSTHLYERE